MVERLGFVKAYFQVVRVPKYLQFIIDCIYRNVYAQ